MCMSNSFSLSDLKAYYVEKKSQRVSFEEISWFFRGILLDYFNKKLNKGVRVLQDNILKTQHFNQSTYQVIFNSKVIYFDLSFYHDLDTYSSKEVIVPNIRVYTHDRKPLKQHLPLMPIPNLLCLDEDNAISFFISSVTPRGHIESMKCEVIFEIGLEILLE